MMTARLMVRRVTPPMKAPAPISANAPGSTHAQGLGGRKTPGGALRARARQETHAGHQPVASRWCALVPHFLLQLQLQRIARGPLQHCRQPHTSPDFDASCLGVPACFVAPRAESSPGAVAQAIASTAQPPARGMHEALLGQMTDIFREDPWLTPLTLPYVTPETIRGALGRPAAARSGDVHGRQADQAPDTRADQQHGHEQAARDGRAGRPHRAAKVEHQHDDQRRVAELAVRAAREQVPDGVLPCAASPAPAPQRERMRDC